MATTLGTEKKRNDLTKREEKMTNAAVRTAASEPSQHTTRNEESRIEQTLFKYSLCSNLISVCRSSTEA